MIGKLLFKALLSFRNLAVLIVLLAVYAAYNNVIVLFIALGAYAALVIQSLSSKKFHEKVQHREKTKKIEALNDSCSKLSYEAKKCLSAPYYTRLRKVMDDKNDIVNSFLKGEKSYLKEKIVEQSLNLVISYLKLLANFSKRSKELSSIDVTEIANRVTANNFKLNSNLDPRALEDIKRAVEMDEKIIVRLKEEKQELERINAKLNYMESMVNMFKQQIISSIESDDMLEKLETAVNEATALDNVLDERRKNKYTI
jgi:hypothetical protein